MSSETLSRKYCEGPASDPALLDYLRSLAVTQDDGVQKRLLKELIRQYVVLERRVDGLLKNTLPAEVADEIKDLGRFSPRACDCSILFADIAGFTGWAEGLPGERLVELLDRLFREMDDLILHFRGTKVKTIGDAYMAVFGAPQADEEHPALAVKSGLAMLKMLDAFNKSHGQALRLRIGIHTGTVMAGVVGKERMQFDIFGDHVNIASRFESAGVPGRVNISHETYLRIRDRFEFEERGEIALKHKADMKAYFVLRESHGTEVRKKGYDRPVEIAERIYWVGFHDEETNFHCNPYLIVEEGRAVVIDAGSRPDFPVVVMKILQAGIAPEQIAALVYQHPDPDLCGSMSNMVDLCASPDLKILSEPTNNIFLSYYLEREKRSLLRSVDEYGLAFSLNGRILQFFKTPFAHSAGSFVTYDPRTKTLFTSDLFGSLSKEWDLFLKLDAECRHCLDTRHCPNQRPCCPLSDMLEFHKRVMPSEKALQWAMKVISGLDVQMIAPQHGSIVNQKEDIDFLVGRLANLKGVGIDGL